LPTTKHSAGTRPHVVVVEVEACVIGSGWLVTATIEDGDLFGTGPRGQIVESVMRACRLLGCFRRDRPEMSLTEFVRCAGYSKSTTYRLLATLEAAGWVERTQTGGYQLTIVPFQIGSTLIDSSPLREVALPEMASLAGTLRGPAFLTIPAGTQAVCIERVDQGIGLQLMELGVGGSQPLHLGAGPRVLLAFNESEYLPSLLATGLEARTKSSIVDADELRKDLEGIRRRGYSISDSDATDGVAALGAPVFDSAGRAVAALSVGGVTSALLPPRPEHVSALLDACSRISSRLGFRPT
jgi:DNA-binding IclR family transcriptional regulator